jgi:hypothetical protein
MAVIVPGTVTAIGVSGEGTVLRASAGIQLSATAGAR